MNNTALVHLKYRDYKDHTPLVEKLASEIKEDLRIDVYSDKYYEKVKIGLFSSRMEMDDIKIFNDLKSPYTKVRTSYGYATKTVDIYASCIGENILKLNNSFQTRKDLWIDVNLYDSFMEIIGKENE